MGLRNVQMFDTPIGRLSVRQLIIIAFFGGLGWLSSFPFADIIYKIAVAGAVFGAGLVLAMQKLKVITPERAILLAFGFGRTYPKRAKAIGESNERKRKKEEAMPVKRMRVSADLESPVKVVGVLRDPSTGEVLRKRPYDVIARGEPCGSGVSDEQGFFTAFFMPKMYGEYTVEVRPEGYARGQVFRLIVEPKGGVKVA
jgi:hypothetical protein